MLIAAEQRPDGVFVVAGVELVEPIPYWKERKDRRTDDPMRPLNMGDRIRNELQWSLRRAGVRDPSRRPDEYSITHWLKRCSCGAAFVGVSRAQRCPACKREATLAATRASVRRLRAKRQSPPERRCRQCGAPMTAKRSTKAFCSEKCRVAAHRAHKIILAVCDEP